MLCSVYNFLTVMCKPLLAALFFNVYYFQSKEENDTAHWFYFQFINTCTSNKKL